MKHTWQWRRTTLWLLFFGGVLAGIGLARTGSGPPAQYLLLALPMVCLAAWRRRVGVALIIIGWGVGCGWWRGSAYLQATKPYRLETGKTTITVQALNDALYNTHKQLSFDAGKVTLADGRQLPGKIALSGFGADAVFQGDELQATGKLYHGYGAYQASMSFAQLELIAHHPSLISELRQKFTAGMQTALPEPLAPFAMGLLVGQRATLPDNVKQDLLMVGLTHIIAVSGYNLTIILQASRRLFSKQSKRIATGLSFALIAIFLLIAGASASIVRAAIVSMLSITAQYYGRSFRPLLLIVMAAAVTAWANPVYVWSDLSWYLSFLAFYGVMIVSPLIQKRLPGTWHESLIGSVALESVCAELMSLPFILYIFGQMSLIGLPANILVVTLVPLAMLLSLFAGLAGMLLGPLSGWVAWPAQLLLTYMLDTAHLLAGLPHIFIQNRSLSLGAMLGIYGVIVTLTTLLWHKTKSPKRAIITDITEINE